MAEATAGLPVRRFPEPSFAGIKATWATPSPGADAGGPKPLCGLPAAPACQGPGQGTGAVDRRKVAACKASKDPVACLRDLGLADPPPRTSGPATPAAKTSREAAASQGRTGSGH